MIVLPVVYIDMLFLINLLMNTITLYASSLILRRDISLLRLFLVASSLSVYACIMFFPDICILYSGICKFIVLVIAAYAAFPTKNKWQIVRNAAVFFGVCTVFGGTMMTLIFATDFGTRMGSVVSNGEIYLSVSPSVLIFSVFPAYACVYIISYIKKRTSFLNPQIMPVEIYYGKQRVRLNAFADTGCGLCDPITHLPAIIINQSIAKKLLPKSLFNYISRKTSVCPNDYSSHCRLLIYSTIDNAKGIMYGFVPDRILIEDKEFSGLTVAVSDNPVCPNLQYDGIFNPIMLSRDKAF